jgi:YHS domain-containing protein
MSVEQRDGAPHYAWNGTTAWFCSTACRDEYAADPDRFAIATQRNKEQVER